MSPNHTLLYSLLSSKSKNVFKSAWIRPKAIHAQLVNCGAVSQHMVHSNARVHPLIMKFT